MNIISFEEVLLKYQMNLETLEKRLHEAASISSVETYKSMLDEDDASGLRLASLFIWAKTPEGHNYWSKLEKDWVEYIHQVRQLHPRKKIPIYKKTSKINIDIPALKKEQDFDKTIV